MTCRKVYLASPREPSGATWLINCLLELGIRTFRYSPRGMWQRQNGRWRLSAHEQVLRKWLPALSDHDSFDFREDIEVQWMHEWRSERHANSQILYFVRDPRDSLFSRYKREAPLLSFAEFVAFPDVRTLLDKVVTWRLFNERWLSHPNMTVVRFEDYKMNAERTLSHVLDAMGLEFSDTCISRAVQASTYDRTAAAERVYRSAHPEDTQIINRSGQPMEWKTGLIDRDVISRIESVCADVLRQFGYPSPVAEPVTIALDRNVARLRFFHQLLMDRKQVRTPPDAGNSEDSCLHTLEFATRVNVELLTRANLPKFELDQLKASLIEFLDGLQIDVENTFSQVEPSGNPADPEVTPLDRLKRGVVRRFRWLIGRRD